MAPPQQLIELVERFDRNKDSYTFKQLPQAKTPHDKESLQRQITTTDHQIDQLVYEFYGLTEEEIKIVEEI